MLIYGPLLGEIRCFQQFVWVRPPADADGMLSIANRPEKVRKISKYFEILGPCHDFSIFCYFSDLCWTISYRFRTVRVRWRPYPFEMLKLESLLAISYGP